MTIASTTEGPGHTESAPHPGPTRLTGPLKGSVWGVGSATRPDGTMVIAAGDSEGKVAFWDGANGELLAESMPVGPSVLRAIAAVTLPDGQIRFATAGSVRVQLWDGAAEVTTGAMATETSSTWSIASLTLPGPKAVLFTGGDDGRIHRWDAETGARLGEPFGDHTGPVRAMAVGPVADGVPTLVTGGDDRTACRWNAEPGSTGEMRS